MSPLGKNRTSYVARGNQRQFIRASKQFNIDNGAGTTDDDQILNLSFDAYVTDVRAIYQEATDSSGAAGANFKLGITAGGATIVAATALEVSKAIGDTTVATVVSDYLPANTTLWIRHTGIATTDTGTYIVQVTVMPKP